MHRESPPSRVAKMAVRTREAAEESVASVWYVSLSVARAASPEAPARIIWATVSTHPGISSCRPGVPPVPPRTHNLTKDVVAGVSQGGRRRRDVAPVQVSRRCSHHRNGSHDT
jgi:hypothetical protein